MTLPSSGVMTAAMVNVELGRASNAFFNMNGAAERALAGVPSGGYGMNSFYGKSNGIVAGTLYSRGGFGNGYANSSVTLGAQNGAITPDTYKGQPIAAIFELGAYFYVAIQGNLPRGFWGTLHVYGVVILYEVNAIDYYYGSDGNQYWIFSPVGFPTGDFNFDLT